MNLSAGKDGTVRDDRSPPASVCLARRGGREGRTDGGSERDATNPGILSKFSTAFLATGCAGALLKQNCSKLPCDAGGKHQDRVRSTVFRNATSHLLKRISPRVFNSKSHRIIIIHEVKMWILFKPSVQFEVPYSNSKESNTD